MNDWTSGYVTDVTYTYGYYPELNPLRTRLHLLNAGLRYPEIRTACELGFGQGVSVNMHAAAGNASWHGTDFNPTQVAFAQELAEASQADVTLYDDSFAEFANRSDLPQFDFIGIHGIWSWISNENRAVLVDFVRRHLQVGGIFYISYNALPGWAPFMPLRHLMRAHAETYGAPGQGIIRQIEEALAFTEKFFATNPQYLKTNPLAAKRFDAIKGQNKHYLAHEYFNSDWEPMDLLSVAKWLAPAKLSYGCSTNFLEHLDAVNLTAEQQAVLRDITDELFRESVRDYAINQQFRRDYWLRGPQRLAPVEQQALLREQRVILSGPRADIPLTTKGILGEATLSPAIYNPILDLLGDLNPLSLGQIERALAPAIPLGQISEAVMTLLSMGHVCPAQDESAIAAAKPRTDKLNAALMDKARHSGEFSFLVSPVTAGGQAANSFQQMMLLGLREGRNQPDALAHYVWSILAGQNQFIVTEGKTLQTPEENLAHLRKEAEQFLDKQLPILKALQIA